MVGHPRAPGVVREGEKLNIIIRAMSEGGEYEFNQRHVEVPVEQLGLENSKPVATPGVEEPLHGIEGELQIFLEPERTSQFRAFAARGN